MSLDAEAVIERRNLRKRLGRWRLIALGIAAIAVVAVFARFASGPLSKQDQIARVEISGLITEDHRQLEMLREIGDAEHVKAVILRVNSPGGTTTGGEALFEEIRELTEKKPVVAVFGTVAASAAYIVGIAADHIIARGNSITGSIGVIFQWAQVDGLLEKLGVTVNERTSGNLKAAPSMFKPLTEEGRALVDEMVADSHRWFIDLVKQRRKVTEASVPGLQSGRIYSGRAAKTFKLIDEIGGEDTAVTWLEAKRNITKDLPIEDWRPKPERGGFGLLALSQYLNGSPTAPLAHALENEPLIQRLRLDGLVSIWHGPAR
ncbi:MAG: signal peptide peptidase SppA [Pseudomonadota bacterium]